MSVNIVQASRASEPWRWDEAVRYFLAHGYTRDEVLEMLNNGIEPSHQVFNGARVDEEVPYPGLPDLEGFTPQWLKENDG